MSTNSRSARPGELNEYFLGLTPLIFSTMRRDDAETPMADVLYPEFRSLGIFMIFICISWVLDADVNAVVFFNGILVC